MMNYHKVEERLRTLSSEDFVFGDEPERIINQLRTLRKDQILALYEETLNEVYAKLKK